MSRALVAFSLSLLLGLTFSIGANAQSGKRASNAADSVPKYDIAKDCQAPASSSGLAAGLDQSTKECMDDEQSARSQLQREWMQYKLSDREQCIAEAGDTGADLRSYVELLTCLQMQRDAEK